MLRVLLYTTEETWSLSWHYHRKEPISKFSLFSLIVLGKWKKNDGVSALRCILFRHLEEEGLKCKFISTSILSSLMHKHHMIFQLPFTMFHLPVEHFCLFVSCSPALTFIFSPTLHIKFIQRCVLIQPAAWSPVSFITQPISLSLNVFHYTANLFIS